MHKQKEGGEVLGVLCTLRYRQPINRTLYKTYTRPKWLIVKTVRRPVSVIKV